jgi:AraC-like DNA-binding protein
MTASDAAAPQLVRYSTDDLPARDRFAVWREVVGPTFMRLDVSSMPDHPFRASGTLCALPGLGIQWADNSGIRLDRTRGLLSDGADDLVLPLATAGRHFAFQRGRQTALDARETALLSTAEVGSVTCTARSRAVVLRFPRMALASAVPDLEDMVGRPLPRACEALQLLTRYVELLRGDGALTNPALGRLAATHVHDLIALAVGAARDAPALACGRGLRAARLRAIKADIRANLASADLCIGAVARRQGVTPRYVHMLFEGEGTTFSRFVLGERLDATRHMLSDARHDHQSIAAIAYSAGYGDLSYFNRAFRSRFGATPSEVRKEGSFAPYERRASAATLSAIGKQG